MIINRIKVKFSIKIKPTIDKSLQTEQEEEEEKTQKFIEKSI